MIQSGKGIVFHGIKYGDTSVIVRVYTRESGLLSFLVKGVRSKKGNIRPSHLMPLNLVELVYEQRQNATLHYIRELKCEPVLMDMHVQPVKRGLAIFMTELVNRAIREEEQNLALFDFLAGSIQILDLNKGNLQLFPHYFCIQLSRYLGFFPSSAYRESDCFDLMEGVFLPRHKALAHFLDEEESLWVKNLCTCTFEELSDLRLSPEKRRTLLDGILRYYRLHLDQFKDLQSPEILREVLSS